MAFISTSLLFLAPLLVTLALKVNMVALAPTIAVVLVGWCRLAVFLAPCAIGGFFAPNRGALGADVKNVYYFAPDTPRWELTEKGSGRDRAVSFQP